MLAESLQQIERRKIALEAAAAIATFDLQRSGFAADLDSDEMDGIIDALLTMPTVSTVTRSQLYSQIRWLTDAFLLAADTCAFLVRALNFCSALGPHHSRHPPRLQNSNRDRRRG